MTDKKAQLSVDGLDQPIELPMYSGTLGPDVIDVTSLVSKGYFTYDPGFMSTGSCESKITFIDGAKGVLLHGGYPIDQLASQSDYLEICYLLLNGELPTAEELVGLPSALESGSDIIGEADESDTPMTGIEVGDDELNTFKLLEQVNELVAQDAPTAAKIVERWIASED